MSMIVADELQPPLSYEDERGKPMPSYNHSIAQMNLGFEFKKMNRYRVASELTLEIDGTRYTPDLSVYPSRPVDWDNDIIRETEMPLTTVEIMSPTQGSYDLMEHVRVYLEAGVKSCWIVAPLFRSIHIYSKGQPMQSFIQGVVRDPITGLEADLAEVFS